jgi:hypothetical protein
MEQVSGNGEGNKDKQSDKDTVFDGHGFNLDSVNR